MLRVKYTLVQIKNVYFNQLPENDLHYKTKATKLMSSFDLIHKFTLENKVQGTLGEEGGRKRPPDYAKILVKK